MAKVRRTFLYATLLACVFGLMGIFILTNHLSGNVVFEESKFSLSNVEQHNSMSDCWIIVENNLYDITPLIATDEFNSFKNLCGKDARTLFNSLSKESKEILEKYNFGVLE